MIAQAMLRRAALSAAEGSTMGRQLAGACSRMTTPLQGLQQFQLRQRQQDRHIITSATAPFFQEWGVSGSDEDELLPEANRERESGRPSKALSKRNGE